MDDRMFGVPCPECGKGTIEPVRFQNYKIKVKAYPFMVPEAVVGVCDTCNAVPSTPERRSDGAICFTSVKMGVKIELQRSLV